MILCSSGVLFRPETFDADAILTFGPRLPVDGLEVLVTRRMVGRLQEVPERLGQCSLRFPVVHAPKRVGAALPTREAVDQLEETATFAAAIGSELVVLHLWDLPKSDADFDGRLEAAVLAADIIGREGLELAVETIPCEHGTPLGNLARVVEREPRVSVALDTEFLAFHNELDAALEAAWLWTSGSVRHVHVKDYTDGLFDSQGVRRYLLPGQGSIDFRAVFGALEAWRFSGSVSLEASALLPDGQPDVEALSRALKRMSRSPWAFD